MLRMPGSTLRRRLTPSRARPTGRAGCLRLLIPLGVAVMALVTYFGSQQFNPITGEDQYVSITTEQEIALGLQAAPEMEAQYGGEEPDPRAQQLVQAVGERLARETVAAETEYPLSFTLLNDDQTVNAFALPGGPTYITNALFQRLETEGQLAGVLGHEIGHVLARHSAQRIAQQQLTEGLTGAVVLATYDPDNPSTQRTAQVALLVGQLVTMRFGRQDELESDRLGVRLLAEAGYDPRSLIRVMEILAEAGGGARQPEFFSTHPDPGNRIAEIEAAIQAQFPQGVPQGLTP